MGVHTQSGSFINIHVIIIAIEVIIKVPCLEKKNSIRNLYICRTETYNVQPFSTAPRKFTAAFTVTDCREYVNLCHDSSQL
ncbi:hypothetical protein GDO81_000836 [Engystomops pustulosus]|uniref:Uncharacterized protein n=1 Tax=Engystomops pustulosus TaxID=76066 RepID=A0AAV7D8G2_ENGPU|nr:hypothetical protein GDO81_000836 [Engystomops pustulosus]